MDVGPSTVELPGGRTPRRKTTVGTEARVSNEGRVDHCPDRTSTEEGTRHFRVSTQPLTRVPEDTTPEDAGGGPCTDRWMDPVFVLCPGHTSVFLL